MISKLIRLFLHILPLHAVYTTDQRHFLPVRNSMFPSSAVSSVPSGGAVAHLLTNSEEAFNSYGGNLPNNDGTQMTSLTHQSNERSEQRNQRIPNSTPIIRGEFSLRHLSPDQLKSAAAEVDSVDGYDEMKPIPASTPIVREPAWLRSGKFQGDIDGVDEHLLRQLKNPAIQFNALRNRQLIWLRGVIPYELDLAFSLSEVRLLQHVFRTYRRRTFGCIRFRPRRSGEADYLSIVKGNGCYSQVGKTGGKQELSLGRGCLFNETITHELMHSLGFWHEHSRADRDEHIIIRWENILPGMDSQFDIVSSAIQDTLGEPYDYRSIMHYGSSAFSRNGRNTLEAVADEFTNVIGTAMELSEMDVAKIMKLYRCKRRESSGVSRMGVPLPWTGAGNLSPWRKRKMPSSSSTDRHQLDNQQHNQSPLSSSPSSTQRPPFVEEGAETVPMMPMGKEEEEEDAEFGGGGASRRTPLSTTTRRAPAETGESEGSGQQDGEQTDRRRTGGRCRDHFLDCPQFHDYCKRISFYFIMRSYCPHTCGRCNANVAPRVMNGAEESGAEEDESEEETRTTTHGKRKRAAEKKRRLFPWSFE